MYVCMYVFDGVIAKIETGLLESLMNRSHKAGHLGCWGPGEALPVKRVKRVLYSSVSCHFASF